MITENEWDSWQEQGLFNNSLIRLWMTTWNMGIKQQRHYGLALLIKGISTLLMKNKIMIETKTGTLDPRIPIIYFSDSGSGKGMGADFYQSIFKTTKLNISSIAKPTPEKLIGSFDDVIDKENKKKGYTPQDEKYRDPVIHGFLETEDDIIFDEAETFFDGKEYGNDILRKTRMALDKYGTSNNKLKSETLKNRSGYSYPCSCNVMFLSYHIERVSKQILANGIFQRALCFFYRLSETEMRDILLNPTNNLTHIIEQNKTKLTRHIKEIQKHIEELQENIKLTDKADQKLQETMQQELKYLYSEDEELGKLMQSFLPRIRDTTIKVAVALAIMKKKKIVEEIEIEEAKTLVLGVSFPSLIREVAIFGILAEEQTKWYQDLKRYLGSKWRKKDEINIIMAKVWSVSRPTVISRLKKLLPLFTQKKGDKHTIYYKIK